MSLTPFSDSKLPLTSMKKGLSLKLFKSSSESKRSIIGGGVKIDSQRIINPDLVFESKKDLEGKILQIGKKIIKRFEN